MAENTKIEWATHTFNPWVGCTKVSPACDHCYAEGWAKRSGMVQWGAGAERRRTSVANWRMPEKWNRQAEIQFSAWERFQVDNGLSDDEMFEKHGFIKPQRPRVFCSSLADVFDNAVPTGWRIDLMNLILRTPYLDWLLLTKRIGNAEKMLDEALSTATGGMFAWRSGGGHLRFKNVWLGATISSQEEADRDIPKLLATPAAKRFLSMEPLLDAVDLTMIDDGTAYRDVPREEWGCVDDDDSPPGLWWNALTGERTIMHGGANGDWSRTDASVDWVIVGGESGTHARPMHPDWVAALRDQCQSAGVAFMFKQWGEWAPAEAISDEVNRKLAEVWIRKDGSVIDGGEVDFFGGDAVLYRAGKKDAGRLLDGRTWDGVPA